MVEKIEGVKPTRMELLAIRKKKELAKNGHKLLSEKRDALISRFFEIIDERMRVREEVREKLKDAYRSLMEAELSMGRLKIEGVAREVHEIGEVRISSMNIMGVLVPRIHWEMREHDEPPYGFLDTTAKLDVYWKKMREAYKSIMKLAELESTLEMLAKEIEKTKRRVNALDHIFIPRLEATEKYIRMVLEEREREDFFRRKRIKAILMRRQDEERGG